MDETQTEAPAKAIHHLTEALEHTAESQRAFLTEITQFTKDETLRFVNQRLDRNSQLLQKLQNAQGLAGLISVQQEWLRDLLSDYSSQHMRTAQALRGVAQTVAAKATSAASETVDRMHAGAQESVRQGEQIMADTQNHIETTMQDMGNSMTYAQDTQH